MYGRYVLFSLPGCASRLVAQDPFEIHIYEYEPMWLGQYSLEAQLNADFMFLNGWSRATRRKLPAGVSCRICMRPSHGDSPSG